MLDVISSKPKVMRFLKLVVRLLILLWMWVGHISSMVSVRFLQPNRPPGLLAAFSISCYHSNDSMQPYFSAYLRLMPWVSCCSHHFRMKSHTKKSTSSKAVQAPANITWKSEIITPHVVKFDHWQGKLGRNANKKR